MHHETLPRQVLDVVTVWAGDTEEEEAKDETQRLARDLLQAWSSLKEAFKIPKVGCPLRCPRHPAGQPGQPLVRRIFCIGEGCLPRLNALVLFT